MVSEAEMPDYFISGAAQAPNKALVSAGPTLKGLGSVSSASSGGGRFENVLAAHKRGISAARDLVLHDGVSSTRDGVAKPTPEVRRTLLREEVGAGVKGIVEDVLKGQNKLEEMIRLALSGRTFSTQELLALQAGAYRFTQELELVSKVVEKGTASIKQTMSTQV